MSTAIRAEICSNNLAPLMHTLSITAELVPSGHVPLTCLKASSIAGDKNASDLLIHICSTPVQQTACHYGELLPVFRHFRKSQRSQEWYGYKQLGVV